MSAGWPERVWYDDSPASRAARALLAPASWLYAGATSLRNQLYDAGVLRAIEPSLPALVVGNLSVGGTGKTPVAAWAASRLLDLGAHPAIVLRGYGDDEPLVHARLNPSAMVIADADRVRGVERARLAGADCAILDDAFQHRRVRRRENWLLVAAEQWRADAHCLPAGPLREPIGALVRASLIVVTRKSAGLERALEVAARTSERAPHVAIAIVHLAPHELHNAHDGSAASLADLDGKRVLAIAAVGAPAEFFAQLRHAGAQLEEAAFRDHHAFDVRDAQELRKRGARCDVVLCTLKDVVKLAPLWPQNDPPLWYVSQRVDVERGRAALDTSLANILAARASVPPTAGSTGPNFPDHGYRSSTADQ